MKRSRPTKQSRQQTTLSASEFAAVLNAGEDPYAIWSVLKRFAQTVRRERKEALGILSLHSTLLLHPPHDELLRTEDEESNEEEELLENQQPDTKKRCNFECLPSISPRRKLDEKKWMEDTRNYNVPFVGTSTSFVRSLKDNVGSVAVGTWPTGLLQAYLAKSPMAMELTSAWTELASPTAAGSRIHKRLLSRQSVTSSKHNKQLSAAIIQAYLEALAELMTAAIPRHSLMREYYDGTSFPGKENDYNKDEVYDKFLPTLVAKEQLIPNLTRLLSEETGFGKGKTGMIGGVGRMAAPVVTLLYRLSMTSLGVAREVVRALEGLREGTLRILLRQPSYNQTSIDPKQANDNNIKFEPSAPKTTSHIKQLSAARIACLRLACVLMDWQDATISSCIAAGPSRERKVHPGLLYQVLRFGLHDTIVFGDHATEEDESPHVHKYLRAVSQLLESVATLLPHQNDRKRRLNRDLSWNQRILFELFSSTSSDALINVCHIAVNAPSLESAEDVLCGADEVDSSETRHVKRTGVRARRLLFALLADEDRSPLLRKRRLVDKTLQLMAKVLNELLNADGSLSMQQFLIQCLMKTQKLWIHFGKALMIPDSKATFAFLSRMGFVRRLLLVGPSAKSCLGSLADSDLSSPRELEHVLSGLIPSSLKKQTMAKALQSMNPLVVMECLKVMALLVERYQKFMTDVATQVRCLAALFAKHLPDVPTVVAVMSRFDIFAGDCPKVASVVATHVNHVLSALAVSLPDVLRGVKFDFYKLLGEDCSAFFTITQHLQLQLLQTLEQVLNCEHLQSPDSQLVKLLVNIMISTTQMRIYEKSRSITLSLLGSFVNIDALRSVSRDSVWHELTLWVDGMTHELLTEFVNMIDMAQSSSLEHILIVAEAWKEATLDGTTIGFLEHSPLLTTCLRESAKLSSAMHRLTFQVAGKSLLYHNTPIPLASLILHTQRKEARDALCRYSSALLNLHECDEKRRSFESLRNMFAELFAPNLHVLYDLESSLQVSSNAQAMAAAKQRLSLLILVQNATDSLESGLLDQLKLLILFIAQTEDAVDKLKILLDHCCFTASTVSESNLAVLQLGLSSGPLYMDSLKMFLKLRDAQVADTLRHNIDQKHVRLLLLLWLMLPLCPEMITQDIDVTLLGLCGESPLYATFAYNWFQQRGIHSTVPVVGILSTWCTLVEREITAESARLVVLLKRILCAIAVGGSSVSESTLFSAMLHIPARRLALACLATQYIARKHLADDLLIAESCPFLAVLIKTDPRIREWIVDLIEAICGGLGKLKAVVEESNLSPKEALELFDFGCLDAIILAYSETCDEHDMKRVAPAVLSRAVKLSVESSQNGIGVSLQLLKFCAPFSDSDTALVLETCKAAIDVAVSTTDIRFQSEVLCILKEFMFGRAWAVPAGLSSVLQYLLSRLSEVAPKRIKCWLQNLSEVGQTAGSCASIMLELLGDIVSADLLPTSSSELSKSVGTTVRICLKYGMLFAVPAMACIRFVHRLLKSFLRKQSCGFHLKEHCSLLYPGRIFVMVTSHSHFREVLVGTISEETIFVEEIRVELVHLLQTALILTEEPINPDEAFWKTLLVAYNAGMCKLDRALKNLVFTAINTVGSAQKLSRIPLLDEMDWTGSVTDIEVDEDIPISADDWDWFINGIDLGRVKATLHQFPLWDSLNVISELLSPKKQKSILEVDPGLDRSHSESDSIGESSSPSNRDRNVDTWRGRGRDTRYSPAFVVPQILGVLEQYYSTAMTGDRVDTESYESDRTSQGPSGEMTEADRDFVRVVQRLCEKGALSLSIAALASHCSELRNVALSCLSLFLKAMTLEAATSLSSWRERPQLLLLLNSLQRGLALRRALTAAASGLIETIKIPALSAIFFAKAALVLMKPGDPMFSPINRYFLKIEDSHGAYDEFTRLPAFIALFCSPSDEPELARRKRLWALQFLKDGFIDSSCYRMVAVCHAPELLLSSLESLAARSDQEEVESECVQLIETLTRLVEFGEDRAARHLIGRLGLLSWIRAYLVSSNRGLCLPSADSKKAFLEFVYAAVESTRLYHERESDPCLPELVGLLQPLVDLALSFDTKLAFDELFYSIFIAIASKVVPKDQCEVDGKDGVWISSARRLLDDVPIEWKRDICRAVASVPLRVNEECTMEDAFELSARLLQAALENSEIAPSVVVCLSRMIRLGCFDSLGSGDDRLVESLEKCLSCRRPCFERSSGVEWLECTKALLKLGKGSSGSLFRVARDIAAGLESLSIATYIA